MPGIDRMRIRRHEANVRSGRVPERLGFVVVERRTTEPDASGGSATHVVWERHTTASS